MAPFARALDPQRARLEVVCLKEIGGNPVAGELQAQGVEPRNLGTRNLRDVRTFRRFATWLASGAVDLVHAHLAYATIWGGFAAGRAGIPCVATLHVLPERPPIWTREGARQLLLASVLRRRAAAVVAVSEAVREAWIRTHRLDPARVVVVPNGIDVERFRPGGEEERRRVRERLGLPAGCPLVLTVCVLRPGKRVETLIDAAPEILAAVPEARFVVVGDGPQRATLEARAAAAGLDGRLRLAGQREDVDLLLRGADVFVLPSEREALPTVLLEAMACGLPVVATATGGVPEVVREGREGCLVQVGDAPALGRAVVSLLPDAARRRALGAAGRRRVEWRYSTRVWVESLLDVYERALAGRHPRPGGRR